MSTVRLHLTRATLPATIRGFVRSRASGLVLVALCLGFVSGFLVVAISATVQFLHVVLFGLPLDEHLSAASALVPWRGVVVPCIGGLVLAIVTYAARPLAGRLADAIEANALYGGRLSLKGSFFVTAQTMISSGFGGSVGLEAGYTQICAAVASRLGITLAARRADMRLLVACGAAGAISGAFNAPLTGAFYGFEVVLGTYTVGAFAPVAASALAACLVTRRFADHAYLMPSNAVSAIQGPEILHIVLISILAALLGIALMRLVGGCEAAFSRLKVDLRLRPFIGGLLIGLLSLITPQVLGAGHGALALDLSLDLAPLALVTFIALKSFASAISLGAGFRGGLFYASLLLGALIGLLYAKLGIQVLPALPIEPSLAALTGIAAFGTGVIGAPVAMTALTFETTGSFSITIAALIAATLSSLIVRDLFGYSFATWRFHLRGEAIRGPHDVGWLRDLSVRKLMRTDVRTAPATWTVEQARDQYPLGSLKNFVVVDDAQRYLGMVHLDDLYTLDLKPDERVVELAQHADVMLLPTMAVREALDLFESSEADVLIVVDRLADRTIVGALSEANALRSYGRELERQSPDNVMTYGTQRTSGNIAAG